MAAVVRVTISTRKQYGGPGIPGIIKKVQGNSAQASYNFARGTEAGAKRRAHVITGHMRNSIRRERLGYGKHRVIVGAHYGVYEEYGTRHRPPHPFFRPAVREQAAIFRRAMREVFNG
jgi:HK97 gp10 family phage protein